METEKGECWVVIYSRGSRSVWDGRRDIISKETKAKQRKVDWMEMYREVCEVRAFKGLYT